MRGVKCPEPKLLAAYRHDDRIQMPLVMRPWAVLSKAIGTMAAKAIDPKADCFPACNHTAIGKQIFHIGCAQRKPVIGSYCISNNFTRKLKTLQPREKNAALARPATKISKTRCCNGGFWRLSHFLF